jgi:hypothetical protein
MPPPSAILSLFNVIYSTHLSLLFPTLSLSLPLPLHRYHTQFLTCLVRKCIFSSHGVRLSPLGTAATVWPIVPAPDDDDDDDCGVIGGMRIGRGNRSTLSKPVPEPLCPPKIPHYLTWARTRAAAVESRRLTAWAMAHLRKCLLSHGCSGSYKLSHVFHEHPC